MFHVGTPDSGPLELGAWADPAIPNAQPSITSSSQNTSPIPEVSRGDSLVGLRMKIHKDSPLRSSELPLATQPEAEPLNESLPMPPDDATDGYEKLYFTHFHHRWPIIHRPPYYDQNPKHSLSVLKLSTFMIGGWISGTVEGKKYALAMHDYLILHTSTILVSIRTKVKHAEVYRAHFWSLRARKTRMMYSSKTVYHLGYAKQHLSTLRLQYKLEFVEPESTIKDISAKRYAG